MALVFGRERNEEHPLEEAVKDLLTRDVRSRAIARNIQYDPRVSPERELVFLELIGEATSAQGLLDGLNRYFVHRVRSQERPEYTSLDLNGHNILSGTPTGSQLHKDIALARVLDLNGLTVPYRWAQDRGWPELADFPADRPQDEVVSGWLNNMLSEEGMGVEGFVSTVIRLLNRHRQIRPFQPTWAVLWAEVEKVLRSKPPQRWLEFMGVRKADVSPTTGRWLVVFKYRVRDVDWLVRPTVLDAGTYAEHFPSPILSVDDLRRYGHPVDLSLSAPIPGLRTEFIHRQIDHTEDQWRAADSICRRLDESTELGLGRQRSAHLERLQDLYEDEVLDWKAV